MELSPDQTIFWQHGFITINLTIVTTWGLMLVLVVASWLITRKLKTDLHISRWQCFLEMIVTGINEQIKEVGLDKPEQYIGFLGTLFLFIGIANLCIIFPGYTPPTASLSTTTALALSVFIAVPFFGIQKSGLGGYLKSYLKPTFIMLPFNLISEVSRTLALAVRLFGNIMSGGMIVAILLSISPFIFPIIMSALGLLTGTVQAYIFSILATVYITAAVHDSKKITKTKSVTTKYKYTMDSTTLIAMASIITAGLTTGIGCMMPAAGEGRAVSSALSSIAQQPDAAPTITRTLFVGLAMIESTAIYCFVVSMILIFANPFWNHIIAK